MADSWRLICPAEDHTSAREISGALVSELERVAGQLGLRCTRDDAQMKLYLGLPKTTAKTPVVATVSASGVVYPSGNMAARHPHNNDARYAPARPSEAAPLVRVEPDMKVSEHFWLSEFRPRSTAYDAVRVHPRLVELLERIRAAAGCPIRITSGYRPPAYNSEVGGVSSSLHLDGLAADIYADALRVDQLHTVCSMVLGQSGGLGYYPQSGFCHVDIGAFSRWTG